MGQKKNRGIHWSQRLFKYAIGQIFEGDFFCSISNRPKNSEHSQFSSLSFETDSVFQIHRMTFFWKNMAASVLSSNFQFIENGNFWELKARILDK